MTELLQYTKDFEPYDSEKPYIKAEYRILIEHDFSQERISEQFNISFLDFDNKKLNGLDINNWVIWSIDVEDYFDRAKINLYIKDPDGKMLPEFRSGGRSLSNDEKLNLKIILDLLTPLLKRAKLYSCFLNYRSRLDYENIFREENKGDFNEWDFTY